MSIYSRSFIGIGLLLFSVGTWGQSITGNACEDSRGCTADAAIEALLPVFTLAEYRTIVTDQMNSMCSAPGNIIYGWNIGDGIPSTDAYYVLMESPWTCSGIGASSPWGFYALMTAACDEQSEWNVDECIADPPPPEQTCDGLNEGQLINVTIDQNFEPIPSQGICDPADSCAVTYDGAQSFCSGDTQSGTAHCVITMTKTANTCSIEPDRDLDETNTATQCITLGGNTVCTEPNLADSNCGYINDDYVCLDSVPDGGCIFFGNGDMICADNSTAPPGPDDGVTPGVPANPDSNMSDGTDTFDIFNSGTVGGSTGATTGGSQGAPEAGDITVEVDFSDIVEAKPDVGQYDDDIDQQISDADTEMQGIIDELSDANDFGESTTLGNDVAGAFGISTSCSDIVLDAFGNAVTFSCADSQIIRDVIGWIMRVLFLIAIFQLVTRRPE